MKRSIRDIFNFDKPYEKRQGVDNDDDDDNYPSRSHRTRSNEFDDFDGSPLYNHAANRNASEEQSSAGGQVSGQSSISEHEGCHDPYIDLNGNVIEMDSNGDRVRTKKRKCMQGPPISFNMHLSDAVSTKSRFPANKAKNNGGGGGVTISGTATAGIPVMEQAVPSTVALDDAYTRKYSARLEKKGLGGTVTSKQPVYSPIMGSPMSIVIEEDEDEMNFVVEKTSNMIAEEAATSKRSPLPLSPSHEESVNKEVLALRSARSHDPNTQCGKKECFLCSWGDKYHDGIKAPHIEKLNMIIDNCYTRYNNDELAQQCHLYFKENVYDPDSGMAMLEKEDVLEHIEALHSLNAKFYLGESIRSWKKIKFILENSVFRAGLGTDETQLDYKVFIALEKTQKMLHSLYKTDIQKLMFNQGTSTEDMNKLGAYHQIMPLYTQKEQRLQIEQKKKLNVPTASNRFI